MTEKPNLAAFAARATKKAVPFAARPADREPVKHLQVRVTRDDAVRFRRVAECVFRPIVTADFGKA